MTGPRQVRARRDPITVAVGRTRAGMILERGLRAFWPLGTLLAASWAALAFGAAEALPRQALLAGVGVAAAGALLLAIRGLRRFRWPTRIQARDRVDADLTGRPLAALADRPALGRDDAGAAAVWEAHLARMRAHAEAARAALPDLRLSRDDPWALRLMALVALIAALAFARSDAVDALGQALAPSGAAAVASGPSFEAWVEPPGYTGKPTLYLPEVPPEPAIAAPQGSRVTLRVYGDPDRFALSESVSGAPAPPLAEAAEGIAVASFDVAQSGSIAIAESGSELGAWSFVMQPDAPPEIELDEPISRAPTGETQLAYVARDDYGVVAARAVIALDLATVDRRYGLATDPTPREPLEVDLPLPLSGDPGAVAETLVEDFSKHPWVGLPVTVTLIAEDARAQTGTQGGIAAALPGRRFYNPVAAALVEQRRDLLWSEANARRVAQVLRAVTWRPENGAFGSERAYLATRIAIRRLDAARNIADPTAQIEDVAEMLWQAALLLEEGSLGDAAERLARAQERLQQALRGDASDEEIAQLMDELRQATRDYMQQLAEEAIRNGEQQQAEGGAPPGQSMTQDQIQELMNRIQELSEQGRRAEAEALLEMLQQLLENMEMQLAQGGQGQGGEGSQGEQSMQDLGDALREQQDLADDSFQELQRQFREGRGQTPGQGQGQPGDPSDGGQPSGDSLADRQDALRELMEQLEGALPGEAGEAARQALRDAERNMGEAGGDLRDGDTAGALDRQAEAIDNMREGMREIARDMRRAETGQGGGDPGAEGEAYSEGRDDPLGRPFGNQGNLGASEQMLPDADAAARARGLLDEIRRRSGDQARPQLELDYLRRLLDRF